MAQSEYELGELFPGLNEYFCNVLGRREKFTASLEGKTLVVRHGGARMGTIQKVGDEIKYVGHFPIKEDGNIRGVYLDSSRPPEYFKHLSINLDELLESTEKIKELLK